MRYDPITDIEGVSETGIDTVLVDRTGTARSPEVTYVLPDLTGLPGIVEA